MYFQIVAAPFKALSLTASPAASRATHFDAPLTNQYQTFGIKADVQAVIQLIGSKATSKANQIGADTTLGAPAFCNTSPKVDLSFEIFLFIVSKRFQDLSPVAYFTAQTIP